MSKYSFYPKFLVLIRKLVYVTLGFIDKFILKRHLKIVILCYHSISKDNWFFSVSPSEFKKQMEYMISQYQPIRLIDIANYLDGKKEITKPSFAVTFDDGYADILCIASYLKNLQIKPTVFVVAKPNMIRRSEVRTKLKLLSKQEIKKLINFGWDIGCHSMTHPDFYKINKNELFKEIVTAKKELEETLSIAIESFGYPKGRYTQKILKLIENSGYKLAVSMNDEKIDKKSNRFTLPRLGVNKTHSLIEFSFMLAPSSFLFRKFSKRFVKF